jgi:truncated hemoglobin YjbI
VPPSAGFDFGGGNATEPRQARPISSLPGGRRADGVEGGTRSANIDRMGAVTSLLHRRFLPPSVSFRPFRGTDLFARLGGQATVDELVDTLYDRFVTDEQLRPFFDRDLTAERARQKLFFAEWLGGPAAYSQLAWAGLVHRHAELPISSALAGRWLGHFRRALESVIPAGVAPGEILERVQELAFGLVNDRPPPERGTVHGMCLSADDPVVIALGLARRGDVPGLGELRSRAPALLDRPLHAAAVLHQAVSAGKEKAVTWLLDQGVDLDKPSSLPVGVVGVAFEGIVFVTPLCAARRRRRAAVAALLERRGAKEDVFTAAFLGDQPGLGRLLAADPSLAQAPDPAVDVLEVTPVHHAVSGGSDGAVGLVLDQVAGPLRGAERALRGAAALGKTALVARLLAMGADARGVGVGRWVLHPELAALLAAAGATVAGSGNWIGASCTGNQGRKDDPEFVRALLQHGARVEDRRPGSEATALHHAARAGFLRTIALLLERGADPTARDAAGETPLDWLDRAAKSVDRPAVRALLGGGRVHGS